MFDPEKIKILVLDVDGTLTDSGVYYDNEGQELKRFSTRDYVGVMAAHFIGIKVIIVTGRESYIVQRRAKEMKIDFIYQGEKNKLDVINRILYQYGMNYTNIAYIGDDLNDLAAMRQVGFKACPADACIEIKDIADYISAASGGKGAVQDVMRYFLNCIGKWEQFIEDIVLKGY